MKHKFKFSTKDRVQFAIKEREIRIDYLKNKAPDAGSAKHEEKIREMEIQLEALRPLLD